MNIKWSAILILQISIGIIMATGISYLNDLNSSLKEAQKAITSIETLAVMQGGRLIQTTKTADNAWSVTAETHIDQNEAIEDALDRTPGLTWQSVENPLNSGPYLRAGYDIRAAPRTSVDWTGPLTRTDANGIFVKTGLAFITVILLWHSRRRLLISLHKPSQNG